ncbi:hypothetical protein WJU16_15250 [Chitinophaga pollutisoli]|uniref:Uncharacterized protein n=1 Tax=Chitinophaga pollutisoli TaxID=3133966 RepID=A0ABZ2YI13_9BACT
MEFFTITIDGQRFEVKPFVKGYGMAFHVDTGDGLVVFELDEEDNLRAIAQGPVPPDAALVGRIADAIVAHYA